MRCVVLSAAIMWVYGFGTLSAQPIPAHHEAQIRKAVEQVKPRVAPAKPRTVLIWNTPPAFMPKDPHKGYCIPYGEAAMRLLGEVTGAFRPQVGDDVRLFLPESLRKFDAVVLNNASGPWIRPTEADLARFAGHGRKDDRGSQGGQSSQGSQGGADAIERRLRQSLVDWLAGGRGLVAYHFAIAGNPQWPHFQEMIGGKFVGHPWNEEVGIRIDEPGHPLVAAFGGKGFRVADEIYEFGPPYSRDKLRVLLSLDTATTNMKPKWGPQRKDGDFAQAWVKPYGRGRVFYTGLGHRTEIYSNPTLLQFYLDAIQFACGDLDAPTPSPPVATSQQP